MFGADKRTRTSTTLRSLGPEPSASASSAISALKEKIGRAFFKGDYTNIYWLAYGCQTSARRWALPKIMGDASEKIPVELAKELRTLAHDLSNALETIVQATYLISQAGPPENSRRWVELIDQASQEAVRINQKLRQILRSQS